VDVIDDDESAMDTLTSDEWIPNKQLEDIFVYYCIRKFDEELKEIINLGGIRAIMSRLRTERGGMI
jgi:hypothetical protein